MAARTPKFFRFANTFLGLTAYGGTQDGKEGSPYGTLTQYRAEIAAGSRLIVDPRSLIGLGVNGGANSSEMWLPDSGFGAIAPPGGATIERWDIGDAWDDWEFTFDSHIHVAAGAWSVHTGTIYKTNVAWNKGAVAFAKAFGGHQLGDSCQLFVPMRECATIGDLTEEGDWCAVVGTPTTTTDIYVYVGQAQNPTTFWGGWSIHVGATTGVTGIYLRTAKRWHIKKHLLRLVGGGLGLKPGTTAAGSTDVEDIIIDSLTHRAGVRDAVAIGATSTDTWVRRVTLRELDADAGSHPTKERKNLNKERNTENCVTVAGQAEDIDIIDPNGKGYSHGMFNIYGASAAGGFGYPSADKTVPRRVRVWANDDQHGIIDCGATDYMRGFTVTAEGGVTMRRLKVLNQGLTSQISGNVHLEQCYFGPMRQFVNPLGTNDYGGGNHLTVYDSTGNYVTTDCRVVDCVFDQPWNYCVAISFAVGASKLLLARSLFIETATGWARKEHVAEGSSIAHPGSIVIVYGNGTSDVGNYPKLRDNAAVMPAGETRFAQRKINGSRTYESLTLNDALAGGAFAGNVAAASLAALGFDAVTFKRLDGSITRQAGGPLIPTLRFRGDPAHAGPA